VYRPAGSALQPSLIGRFGLLASAVALAIAGGVLAATLALLDLGALREGMTRLEVGGRTGATAPAIAVAVGIAVLAALSGTLVGAPLGVAYRAQPRAAWSMGLRILGLVPLALPPLALALGLDRLLETAGWLEAPLRAIGLEVTPVQSVLALTLAHIPLAAAIVGVVVSVVSAGPDAATLETARLLGAGRRRRFVTFELPPAMPAVALGAAFAFLLVATSVAAVLSLTARTNP
jgi:ABC-type Fe3+ transport system permease subunit